MQPLSREDLPRAISLLLAVFTGLLLGAGYAPMGIWPATIVGVGLLTWLVAGCTPWRAAGLGAVAGLAMNSLTIHWIGVLGVPVAIALVAFMSLWSALLGAMVALLTRLQLWVLWVPCVWVAVELAGGRVPFGGFPWIRLAYTTVDQPLSGWLAWVGSVGVSFLLALVAQLGLEAVRSRENRLRALVSALAIMVLGGSLKWVPQASPEQQVTIGVAQGNVNRYLHGTPYYAASVTDNMLSETVFLLASNRASGAAPLDLVVWPENATDVDPLRHPAIRQLVDTSVALAGVPIFVGAVMDGPEPDTRQTSSIWWTPDTGPGDRYDKRNLVPFGEYIPFRNVLLPRLPVLEQIGRQSIAGIGPGVVAAPTADHKFLRVGAVICFELAWDDTVYDTVLAGADIIVTQSNTNTYGATFEVPQQLALNRVRAMELGREVVVSTLNSLTGLVDSSGTFHDSTAEFTAAHRTFTVPLRTNVNMAVRLNPWLGWALAVVGVGATLWAGVRTRRSGASDRLPPQSSASIGSTQ